MVLLLAWIPLAVMLPLAASRLADDPVEGLMLGARSAIVGAVLMGAVWKVSGRFPWPERAGVLFYVGHFGAALLFGAVWRIVVLAFGGLPDAENNLPSYVAGNFSGPLVLWDLLLKMIVYGLVVALSYAVRESERARAEGLRAARFDALASRAQLASLRSQLNPHFLFNTLHSLTVLIQRNPTVAEEAVYRLSDMLRFTLRHSGVDTIAFSEELRFVDHYVSLEQLRFEQRLLVITDVDSRAPSVLVPPFCLQPLVENAIRHGLSPKEEGGTVWITAQVENDVLSFTVRDNGVGVSADDDEESGSGLASLRQRIEALHGGGTLTVDRSERPGFAVSVRIPLDPEDQFTAASPAVARSAAS